MFGDEVKYFDEQDDCYNKCLGQNKCNDCPRYLDDCDGKEEMIEDN